MPSDPFSESATLSNIDLEKWCHENNLQYNLVSLNNLENRQKFNFLFTGDKETKANNGYHNHWMFLYGNYLFDSYGYQNEYQLPDDIKFVNTYPKRLQQFNSNVCGEYCCAFYYFIKHHSNLDFSNIGYQFCNEFDFDSKNREKNDEIVLNFYNDKKTDQGETMDQDEYKEKEPAPITSD